jgi:hypothetical protein
MRAVRLGSAALAAAVLAVGVPTSGQAAVITAAVPNPSFEQVSGSLPNCWTVTGPGTLSVTTAAFSGRSAAQVRGTGAATATMELATARSTACGVRPVVGHAYDVGAYYHATTAVRAVVYTYSARTGWKPWFTGPPFSPSTPYVRSDVVTPAVPAGTELLSVGMSTAATGSLHLDDVSLTDATPEMSAMATSQPSVLLNATFPAANALVTNEYAYWNPKRTDAVRSSTWEMTSGSLFSSASNGYSGVVDAGKPDARSAKITDSAIFRLNTKDYSYGDVNVGFKLNLNRLGSTTKTPAVNWDGVHIWLRYQSQYNLYYASVARRDGHVVIKKKCPGGPSNDGTYYELSKEISGHPMPLNSWNDVAATVRNNPTGTVTVTLYRSGTPVVSATDSGVGCAPITHPGSVGIRGDNAQFQFQKFTVSAL